MQIARVLTNPTMYEFCDETATSQEMLVMIFLKFIFIIYFLIIIID